MKATSSSTAARGAPARNRVSKPMAGPRGPRNTSAGPTAIRRLASFSRPRSSSQLLTLFLVLIALATSVSESIAALSRGRRPGWELSLAVVMLAGALAARTSGWWGRELRTMTWERARRMIGVGLLLFDAAVLSSHGLTVALGLGGGYPLLGPWHQGVGAIVALLVVFLAAIMVLLGVPVHRAIGAAAGGAAMALAATRRRRLVSSVTLETDYFGEEIVDDEPTREPEDEVPLPPAAISTPGIQAAAAAAVRSTLKTVLPPIATFAPVPRGQSAPVDLDIKARRIQETLESFGVGARVVGHHCGPVVTQFDIQPDRGVKVKSITALQNDLALALAAPTIRIQAPVPGKPVIGIEIPNSAAAVVALRELLESEAYRSLKTPLGVVLGKDVGGNPTVIDLAKMPHLLIAGATGSGKSVCVNALISSLLYRNSPEDVRLMMIDPKMVELTVYNGVPHLLSPVVTQLDRVVGVLQWAVREMERRYQLFADTTVRNIQRFNEKMDAGGLKRLPYIVLIIDELADLMMIAPEEVEDAICRLAQLARAAGIHLVIATQRPSVDVVTGLIKANFPARIAFAMTSQVDSRTILDTAGAEKLLGRGDMLYQPPDGPKPVRLQGAFLSDQEIERLVDFWKRSPLQAAVERIAAEDFAAAARAAADTDDELLSEATRTVQEYETASVSLLQRKLRVGYARASRLMDQLEDHGTVGPADGSKQRPVLHSRDSEV